MLDEETGEMKDPGGTGEKDADGKVRVALAKQGLVLEFDFGWDTRGTGFKYNSKSGVYPSFH